MIATDRFPQVEVTSRAELRQWLQSHHDRSGSVWLVTWKKATLSRWFPHQDVVDELLCFGWTDGVRRTLDDRRTMQLISPRRVEHWARSYKQRVEVLTREGLMHPSGLRAVEASKASGLWTFMDDVDDLVVPDDLARALAERPGAAMFFDAIPPASKRFTLRWIKLARTGATREKRITTTADLARDGRRVPGS